MLTSPGRTEVILVLVVWTFCVAWQRGLGLCSAETIFCPLQVSEPQPSHHQLRSRCPRPSEALWDTLPLKEDGDGL